MQYGPLGDGMRVHAVVGGGSVGSTATAVNLAAALRSDGHHAAVLDLTGDVAELFGAAAPGTLADALAGEGTVSDATVWVDLDPGEIEAELRDYHEATTQDDRAFRVGTAADVAPSMPDPDTLPVLVQGSRGALGAAAPEHIDDLLADLAFAYDYVIVDAGTLDGSVVTLADGIIAVTTPEEEALAATVRMVVSCDQAGATVLGTVVNRATDRTDISALRDRLRTDMLAVIPDDAREPTIEPVAFTAPETPVATAYDRLAGKIVDWGGDDGLIDGGPEVGVAADGEGPEEEDGESGFLSRLF